MGCDRGAQYSVLDRFNGRCSPGYNSTSAHLTDKTHRHHSDETRNANYTPELLRLAQVREYIKDAIAKLKASDGNGARNILVTIVNPWFYATAPQNSTDLENAQAHTTARWWCEETTRRIEANKLGEAREILREHVLAWLNSAGPSAIGILGIEQPLKSKAPAKKAPKKKATKKKSMVLSVEGSKKKHKPKKKAGTKTKGK